MFNRTKTVVTFAAGAVAGLTLAACLTVQGSRPGVFGGEALIPVSYTHLSGRGPHLRHRPGGAAHRLDGYAGGCTL